MRADGRHILKYMLLVYGTDQAWDEADREKCYNESTELCNELNAQGKFLGASPLQSVTTATSVRVREGKRTVTDGPFAETHEQLGGFFLIEASDLDEAIAVAARVPGARVGTIEIRPVVELTGLPAV